MIPRGDLVPSGVRGSSRCPCSSEQDSMSASETDFENHRSWTPSACLHLLGWVDLHRRIRRLRKVSPHPLDHFIGRPSKELVVQPSLSLPLYLIVEGLAHRDEHDVVVPDEPSVEH